MMSCTILTAFSLDRFWDFYRRVNIHRRPRIQSDNGSHEHSALQDEIVAVRGEDDPFQESLHEKIADQGLRFLTVAAGKVSDLCFQL